MKISYNWLKELVNIDVSADKLVADSSLYLIEIEGVEKLLPATGLVIGEVVDKRPHENSDHLSVCQVNLDSNVSQIVCGAPNVAKGQKVIVAVPGAHLPGVDIKVSIIRGVPSNGMICSLQELGLESKYVPEKYANGIYVLGDDAIPGEDAMAYLGFNDTVIELGLTPNRMDLMSMKGFANDVNAVYAKGLKPIKYQLHEIDKKASDEISVELQTTTCYSYYARVVEDVKIHESPAFIKARLIASGVRPINNVVDITNYVLMLFGQPLHAFDKDKLGSKIVVRRAHNNETTTTLDQIKRTLNRNDIVITDNLNSEEDSDTRIVCLAGVMGGVNTEVTDETHNLVLESAVFRPLSIRRTSTKLCLRSESSIRFERGVDINQSLEALDYACYLLEKYADAKVLNGYVHQGISNVPNREFKISEKYIKDYLGVKIPLMKIKEIFDNLSFGTKIIDKEVLISVPNRRLDITIKEDLVEEVARIYGYDGLKETLPFTDTAAAFTNEQLIRQKISNTLRGAGLNEVMTYSLISEAKSEEFKVLYNDNETKIALLHPMTEEHKILRRSLVSSLLDVIKYNNARKLENLAIYEIGKRYHQVNDETYEQWTVAGALQGVQATNLWADSSNRVDFYYVKGILELLFTRLGIEVTYEKIDHVVNELHPERTAVIKYQNKVIGFIGELHPKYANQQDIEDTYVFELSLDEIFMNNKAITHFTPISKVPAVFRDLALIMDKDQNVDKILNAIYKVDPKMIKNVEVFDLYVGDKIEESKKSIAVRITLEALETLTEDIINAKITRILKSLEYQYHVSLRN